jgi:Tfp pilus assembly protein PilF
VAAVSTGIGTASTQFTSDRQLVRQAVSRMAGQRRQTTTLGFSVYVSLSEALDIDRGDGRVLQQVVARECYGLPPDGPLEMCISQVESSAMTTAQDGRTEARQTLNSIRNLLLALRSLRDPKTVVFVTEGFILADETQTLIELGALAEASRTTLYALKLDEQIFDVSNSRGVTTPMADRHLRTESLEVLTSAARGTMYHIDVGLDTVFGRIEQEMAGYYLLGVESEPADKDGKPHPLRVSVSRRGLTVRSRKDVISRPEDARPRSPREAMIAALTSPLQLSALPVRLIAFSLRGPEASKVQLLIHADVGANYANSRVVSLGYIISSKKDGKVVDSQLGDGRLPPIMAGVPSPLQYSGGASLDPGEYTIKFAVAEGDRVGSVEHVVQARLVDANGAELSDLVAGGPVDGQDLLRPTVGHTISFGSLHGYVEAYGADAAQVQVRYEIAAQPDSEALLSVDAAGVAAGPERAIFSEVLSVRQLPPGSYVLRAIVTSNAGRGVDETLVRTFEIAPPPVLMTSAEGLSSGALVATDLYLPVGEGLLARPFRREDVIAPATLKLFRDRVVAARQPSFDDGVQALGRGEFPSAESSFKKAVDVDADSTAALAYLGATFAAAGHDQQAAGAWQTSLIEGSDIPEIYQWLGDALLRTNSLGDARNILLEAVEKWPADPRFAKPLALLYATFGQGREAVRTLDRHIEHYPEDAEALALAVEWMYHLRLSNAAAYSRAEDQKRARAYADQYVKTKGLQQALVRQWVDYLEKQR